MNRFDFKPGLLTARTAMALNDISAWIDRMERSRKGDSEFPTVERRRVKLTAHNGGTPPIYTGVEQSFTIAGVEEDKPNGESFSPTNQPIYERNGQTVSAAALTAGFHCWIDRRTLVDGVPTYEFDIGNAGSELKGLTFTSDTDSTADSDPGNGLFKWNNATQGSATVLYFDNLTADGITSATFFASLGSGGFIYLQQSDDASKWQLWKWTATPTAGAGYYKFTVTLQANGGTIADAKTVYTDWSSTAAAGSFTSQEVDGTPSTTTTLKFPNTSLTDNGDGTVTVKDASATETGLVNATGQTYSGVKTFLGNGVDGTVVVGSYNVGGNLYALGVAGSQVINNGYLRVNHSTPGAAFIDITAGGSASVADTTSGSPIITNFIGTITFSAGMPVTGSGIPTGAYIVSIDSGSQITISANATATATGVDIYVGTRAEIRSTVYSGECTLRFYSNSGSPDDNFCALYNSSSEPRFAIEYQQVIKKGLTGTVLYGATTTGGIITALGAAPTSASISGFDEAAQDAVGSILVSSTRVSATYNDGVPSIVHDLITDTITAGYLHATQTEMLFGRTTAGAGAGEEITLGPSLTIATGVMDVDVIDGGTF